LTGVISEVIISLVHDGSSYLSHNILKLPFSLLSGVFEHEPRPGLFCNKIGAGTHFQAPGAENYF